MLPCEPRFRGVIFDLDGTLGHTLPICCEAFRRAAAPYAGRLLSDEEITATFGPSEEGSVHVLAPGNGEQCLEDYIRHYEELHDSCLEPFEGVVPLLAELQARGVKMALVTGKGPRSCEISLRRMNLAAYFPMVEVGDAAGPCKPRGIAHILQQWGLDPSQVAYVGDSPSDVRSSRQAGVFAIATAWADTADPARILEQQPDALFTSVAELAEWLTDRIDGA